MSMPRILTGVAWATLAALGSAPSPAAEQVDRSRMDRAELVVPAGPIDPRIVGAWDVWIPGSVYYTNDGRTTYQHYQPGAAMNRLEIGADGRYRWGQASGRLEEVRPWHHQPGRRYWRVRHAQGSEYEFYRDDQDRLIVLFGGVGGHAATGTRLSGSPDATAPDAGRGQAPTKQPAVRQPASGSTRSGQATDNPLGVEWRTGNTPTQPSQPGNPLGVEWRGSGSGGKATPDNPLGVEWRGSGK